MQDIIVCDAVPEDYKAVVTQVKALAAQHGSESSLDCAKLGSAIASRTIHVLVAKVDGLVLGSAIYTKIFSTWTAKDNLFLEHLYVTPEARGLGLGRLLMSSLLLQISPGGRIELSCHGDNHKSLQFYTSFGAIVHEGWVEMRIVRRE